jgi:hypothetical protein
MLLVFWSRISDQFLYQSKFFVLTYLFIITVLVVVTPVELYLLLSDRVVGFDTCALCCVYSFSRGMNLVMSWCCVLDERLCLTPFPPFTICYLFTSPFDGIAYNLR